MNIDNIYKINIWLLFVSYCILSIILEFLFTTIIITDLKIWEAFTGILSVNKIEGVIEQRKNEWIFIIFQTPLLKIIVFSIEAGSLFIAGQFFNIKNPFVQFLKVIILANFIFIIPEIIRLVIFKFYIQDYNLKDVKNFYPLSLSNIIKPKIGSPIDSVFQYINIFQVLFTCILCHLTNIQLVHDRHKSVKIVLFGYGTLFAFWILLLYLVYSLIQ